MMKRLAIAMLVAIALVGCGRESEQVDTSATQAEDDVKTLTIAWHKVTEDDGTVCDLSTRTQQVVEQAAKDLRRTLAPNGIDVAVETITPAKVEGSQCLCNRVLVQGRFVDEWLGADVVKAPCSGCADRGACPKSAESGSACAGQTAMAYQGNTYEIVPANLLMMAGLIAAADMSGQVVSYGACPGKTAPCAGTCQHDPGTCQGNCARTAASQVETPACPNAAQCQGKPCPLSGN
jgi:hypothetical protein